MEEMHQAAMAYYKNSSPKIQGLASDFFREMDVNGDGRVSHSEVEYFFRKAGISTKAISFAELDRDGDGSLDFSEVVTFFYILVNRGIYCDGCAVFLKGLYFTCVQCYVNASSHNSYDLCIDCYGSKKFSHCHDYFQDNYALLRHMKASSTSPQSSQQPVNLPPAAPSRVRRDTVKALATGVTVVHSATEFVDNIADIADIAAAVCTIM